MPLAVPEVDVTAVAVVDDVVTELGVPTLEAARPAGGCAVADVTVIVWVTWVAGAKSALPDWFASRMHVPAPVKVTTPPVIEHAAAVDPESMVIVTGSDDVAEAVGVYVAS